MKECLTTFSGVFWVLLMCKTVFIDKIIKYFFFFVFFFFFVGGGGGGVEWGLLFLKSQKLMTHRFYGNKYISVIKNLPNVIMQWYKYPELIWMKQNISFGCSNYRSNWQLIDNFCIHLSEPSHIENSEKKNSEPNRDHRTTMHHKFGELFHLYKLVWFAQWWQILTTTTVLKPLILRPKSCQWF